MLNKLAIEVHQNAVEHGWWDEERSFLEVIALCHSELSEALEEYRNKKEITEIYTKCKMDDIKAKGGSGCGVCKYCSANKPEGIPVELADCIIRILDWFGRKEFNVDEIEGKPLLLLYHSFPEFITVCHSYLTKAILTFDARAYLKGLIIEIMDYCTTEGIDIEEAIRIKHDYNKTRPYKHGGKVI